MCGAVPNALINSSLYPSHAHRHLHRFTDCPIPVWPPSYFLSLTHTHTHTASRLVQSCHPLSLSSISLSTHTHTDSDKCIAQSGFPPTLALSLTHSHTFTSRHTDGSLAYLLLPLFRSSYTHVQHTETIINKVIQLQKLLFL